MNILLAVDKFYKINTQLVQKNLKKGLIEKLESNNLNIVLKRIYNGKNGIIKTYYNTDKIQELSTRVRGPLFEYINVRYKYLFTYDIAIIDLENICGKKTTSDVRFDPYKSTSYGIGQCIYNIYKKGINHIILVMGDLSCVDGGVGLLNAFGVKFFDINKEPIKPCAEGLENLKYIETSGFYKNVNGLKITLIFDEQDDFKYNNQNSNIILNKMDKEEISLTFKNTDRFNNMLHKKTNSKSKYINNNITSSVIMGLFYFFDTKVYSQIDFLKENALFKNELENNDIIIIVDGEDTNLFNNKTSKFLMETCDNSKKIIYVSNKKTKLDINEKILEHYKYDTIELDYFYELGKEIGILLNDKKA